MKNILLAGAAVLALGTAAHAAPMIGTFPGAISVAAPGVNIAPGVTLNLGAGQATGAGTGDLSGVAAFSTPISGVTSPFTVANGSAFAFTLDGFGTFSAPSIGSLSLVVNSATSRAIDFFALGTFTPSFGAFVPDPASITGSFTQTGGALGAVSFSFTFASPPAPPPPPPGVPAPAALALFGVALAGLGLASRARKAG